MIYIGIDPGAKGGYAIIATSETGQLVKAYPWDDTFFVVEMSAIAAMKTNVVAAVEKVGAMPGNGSVSMFNFGKSFGFILGVLAALGIPYQLVPPRKWKAEFSLTNDKGKSIEACKRLFPDLDLRRTDRCRTDSDGLAESTLLACYAMRHFGNGEVRK